MLQYTFLALALTLPIFAAEPGKTILSQMASEGEKKEGHFNPRGRTSLRIRHIGGPVVVEASPDNEIYIALLEVNGQKVEVQVTEFGAKALEITTRTPQVEPPVASVRPDEDGFFHVPPGMFSGSVTIRVNSNRNNAVPRFLEGPHAKLVVKIPVKGWGHVSVTSAGGNILFNNLAFEGSTEDHYVHGYTKVGNVETEMVVNATFLAPTTGFATHEGCDLSIATKGYEEILKSIF